MTIACLYVSIICIPQLFSNGSYLYPIGKPSFFNIIYTSFHNYWYNGLKTSWNDYPLIGIYIKAYNSIIHYNNETNTIVTTDIVDNQLNNIVDNNEIILNSSRKLYAMYEYFLNYQYWADINISVLIAFILSIAVWSSSGSLLIFHIFLIYKGIYR